MAVTRISAELMPPKFSADAGTSWLTLVCITDWSLTGATSTNETETFCGKFTSTGVPGMTGSANAVANTTPTAVVGGVGEVSLEMATDWWLNKTALLFKVDYPHPAGTDFYISASALITNITVNGTAGQDVNFSIDWALQGTLDNTP